MRIDQLIAHLISLYNRMMKLRYKHEGNDTYLADDTTKISALEQCDQLTAQDEATKCAVVIDNGVSVVRGSFEHL